MLPTMRDARLVRRAAETSVTVLSGHTGDATRPFSAVPHRTPSRKLLSWPKTSGMFGKSNRFCTETRDKQNARDI